MSGEMKSFADLKLSSWLLKHLREFMGLRKPTPIQQNCIPPILAGEDCIGCAKTGSGKTLAFVLPIMQKCCEYPSTLFALVLAPTRELAFQITDQFNVVNSILDMKICTIVGGMDMMVQGLELRKQQNIVVATPGRLVDHLNSCKTFSLKNIKILVLDEADRMLGGAFDEQLKVIFAALPKQKQVLLFSATMTDALDKVKQVSSNKFFMWTEEDDAGIATVKELDQRYVLCSKNVIDSFLVEIIRTFRATNKNGSIMIFTDTCKHCQLLSMTLNDVGFANMALHGMMKQKDRLAALSKFKSNHVRILIATDVAGRGLDIPKVELVINHSIPNVPKEYIHRVGRTARAGKNGMAISLITPSDIKLLHAIENTIGIKLIEYKVNDNAIVTILTQVSVAKREAEIKLDEIDFYEKKKINKQKKLILEGKEDVLEELNEIIPKKKRRKESKKKKVSNSLI